MNEKEFVNELVKIIKPKFPNYNISIGESLIYKVIINVEGNYHPPDPLNPARGSLAFQTDILIKKGDLPLLVIEVKYGGFSTHDVLTYSTKAIKHKEIYPYLRYGFIVGGASVITNKFFTHNVGFDFALAMPDLNDISLLNEIMKSQISSAEALIDIAENPNRTRFYNSFIVMEA